jgi:hypothetical protein
MFRLRNSAWEWTKPQLMPTPTLAGMCCAFLYVLLSAGCASAGKPASTGFASVLISGNTPGQIRDAASAVFRENGYRVAQADAGGLIFEKKASRMDNFAYGSWLGDTPVWIRVKASVVPAGEMSFRLQCAAYMVHDMGSATEEEVALSHLHRGPYQKLMDDVAKRFLR